MKVNVTRRMRYIHIIEHQRYPNKEWPQEWFIFVNDLGADFRLKNPDMYEKWYGVEHKGRNLLDKAAYGIPEFNRDEIRKAKLIANPGCYPTCIILSIYPLILWDLIDEDNIIIDAKSGVSGAGRELSLETHFTECNESVKPYKVGSHRHTPEIEQFLSLQDQKDVNVIFTPHLIPMNRGILITAYLKLKKPKSYEGIKEIYESHYIKEYFIRLTKKGIFPETRWVKGSNFCDIGFRVSEKNDHIIVVGAIDNMVKGAAGQAVQNMNILFDIPESTGLTMIPAFPA